MRKLRDALSIIVFAAAVAVSIAAAVEAARQGLPEPVFSDPFERMRWLSVNDVDQLPEEAQLRMVHRLEEDFTRDVDWQAQIDLLDDAQWQQFNENFNELTRLWFLQKVDSWWNLPEEQRPIYLEDQFGNLLSWKPLAREAAKSGQGRRGRQRQLGNLKAMGQRMQSWLANENDDVRQRVEVFMKAVGEHLLQRLSNPGQMPGQSWN